MKRLLLFDIDCTLLRTDGAGMAALSLALSEVLGQPPRLSQVPPDGQTDPNIVAAMLREAGLPPARWNALEREILQIYPELLRDELERRRERSRLEPGVRELLAACAAHPQLHLGVLTGNIQSTARLKLDLFDLNGYFPIGAFGCDCADRNRLGPVALERARRYYGLDFTPQETWLIGDTDRDIRAARAVGAKILAVATGGHSQAALEEHLPDLCLPDLSETERVMQVFLE